MKPRSRKDRSVLIARKAEEQERIREIHSALGGSPDAFDQASGQPAEKEASLGSRIDAYIQLQTARRAAVPPAEPPLRVVEPPPPLDELPLLEELPAPVVEPPSLVVAVPPAAPVPVAPPPPAPRRVREPRVKAPRGPSAVSRARSAAVPRIGRGASALVRALSWPARVVVHVVLATATRVAALARRGPSVLSRVGSATATRIGRGASALVRALRSPMRVLVHAVLATAPRIAAFAKLAARTAARPLHALAARRNRPARPVRSREERREPDRLSPTVLQRVQGYTPAVVSDAPVAVAPDLEPEPEPEQFEPVAPTPPSPAAAPREDSREARVVRRHVHVKPRMLLLAAALAGAATAAVLVVDRGHGSGSAAEQAAAVRAMADASTSRTSFANPLAYAGAMTRLALANGRTEIASEPSCDAKSTWKRWSCDAKGRPSVGPFTGRWVTYRCTPSYSQSGGAPATLVVNCRPQNPPPASA